jgi:hypothetical protein
MNMVNIYIEVKFVIRCYYIGSIEIQHHTPNRSSLINISHGDYSPFVHSPIINFQSISPKQNPNNFSGQYRN